MLEEVPIALMLSLQHPESVRIRDELGRNDPVFRHQSGKQFACRHLAEHRRGRVINGAKDVGAPLKHVARGITERAAVSLAPHGKSHRVGAWLASFAEHRRRLPPARNLSSKKMSRV